MKNKSHNKIGRFYLRTSLDERSKISKLARRLGVKSEAEAIRRAVTLALETINQSRSDLRLSPRKTASPSAAMTAQVN